MSENVLCDRVSCPGYACACVRAALARADEDAAKRVAIWEQKYAAQSAALATAESAHADCDAKLRAQTSNALAAVRRAETAERERDEALRRADLEGIAGLRDRAFLVAASDRLAEAEALLEHALRYIENGDFRNGVVDFGCDEGHVAAFNFAIELRSHIAARKEKP